MAEQATSLSLGSRGEVVKELQQWLNYAIGAGIKEDGRYGQKTSQAVSNFQRESGIEEDGIAGVNTIESIISYEGESNEDEESSEENVQGAEEEVTPAAQEEPEEEEVTPEEEAEFGEPTQAPAAPEQDTTPEVTPEEEAEFAAPEGEDPALSQQPQTTTALQNPTVPQGDNTSGGMDPLIQQTVAQPKPRPVPTWSDTNDGSDGRIGGATPAPVPPEIPQATQKIQQQTAGNYQKFHKPAQPSTDPATNTITPADFNHGMSPQANNSEPQAQASTNPATNTIAPEEVPVQGYSSRDMFKQDLLSAYMTFQNMIKNNNHNGIEELQTQIQNIQQRVQGQEQQYPKLSDYLKQLSANTNKWASYAESEIKFRPILTEGFLDAVSDTVKGWISDDDEPNADIPKDIVQKLIDSLSSRNLQPSQRRINKAKSQSGEKVTWTGETIHYYNKGLELFKNSIHPQYLTFLKYEKAIAHRKNWSDDVVRHHSMLKKLFKQFPGIEEYDWDFEGLLTKLPPIIEKGEQISKRGLSTIIHILETLNLDNRTISIDSWSKATEYYNKTYEAEDAEDNDAALRTMDANKDEVRHARQKLQLWKEQLVHMKLNNVDSTQLEAEIKKLEDWLATTGAELEQPYLKTKAERDAALAKAAEEKEKAEKNAAANQQQLQMGQLDVLKQDIESGALPTEPIAKADTEDDINVEEEEAKFTEQIKIIGDRAIALINNTLKEINYTEEDAPSEGPKRKEFLAIGETIAKLGDGIGKYQQSYNHQELVTLESDFKYLNEQVSNYLT